MTKTNRAEMLNDLISDRIHRVIYKAFYIWHIEPTETGTFLSGRFKA